MKMLGDTRAHSRFTKNTNYPHRGEVYMADLSPVVGSEQGGVRAVVVLQNDTGNRYSPTTIVAPMTTRWRPPLQTHVKTIVNNRVNTVLTEQIRTIAKERLMYQIGVIDPETMDQVNHAMAVSLGLPN